jgi:hypothetical protein
MSNAQIYGRVAREGKDSAGGSLFLMVISQMLDVIATFTWETSDIRLVVRPGFGLGLGASVQF